MHRSKATGCQKRPCSSAPKIFLRKSSHHDKVLGKQMMNTLSCTLIHHHQFSKPPKLPIQIYQISCYVTTKI